MIAISIWRSSVASQTTDWVAMNYVPFAETTMRRVTALYTATARHTDVIEAHVLEDIVQVSRRGGRC